MIKDTALVLEGGGFRGMFTAGILDYFLEKDLFFEANYGVSAGAAYGVSYLSKQANRNLEVNQFISDKRYLSINNFLRTGSVLSWDFLYEEIPQRIVPFDYQEFRNSRSKLYVGTSNCLTGEPEFFQLNKANKEDFKTILTASSSLPFASPIVKYKGMQLLDGGLSDAIPFEHALSQGQEKVVVILTQAQGYIKKPLKLDALIKWHYRKHPHVYDMLHTRAERYNASIAKLEQLEEEGKAYLIRPKTKLAIGRLENDPNKTAKVFHEAFELAQQEYPKLMEWLNT